MRELNSWPLGRSHTYRGGHRGVPYPPTAEPFLIHLVCGGGRVKVVLQELVYIPWVFGKGRGWGRSGRWIWGKVRGWEGGLGRG